MKTLADKILRDFSKVKLKKVSVKVPKLRIRNLQARKEKIKKISEQKKDDKIPTSSIVSILIKSAVENAKRDKKEKSVIGEDKSYTAIKDSANSLGGYGTVSKNYGGASSTSYVDYEKLFSYLGKFRAQNPYENFGDDRGAKLSDGTGNLSWIDKNTIEKGARFVKYMKHPTIEIDTSSLVPIAGMGSAEWEQFKLWMKLEPVMYRLKISTS